MARKDWKKQLFRVKQIADQNFGRVEKTEALTANLQALEKTVDQYGKVFSSTGKKLLACLQTQPGQDIEKRQRKLPEYVLSNQLIENSQTLGIDTLIGLVFQISGDAEAQVANKTLELELGIEEKVLSPIHKLIENDIPAITKLKKNLQRVVLDMDSAKTRYHAAQKEQTKAVTNNPQSSTTKVDNLREEYDEACYKVDQCRDQLATEMFTLASREAELSKILLELIKCQASYHKAVLDVLEKRIPQMEEQIQFSQHVPVFGKPIEEHLQRANRKIALVIEVCVKKLIAYGGLEEEGLFRIAGAANKIKKLKAAFDSEQQAGIDEENDVHVIAGTLKLYLRELPDPLMKSSLYSEWMKAAHMPADQRLQALAEVLAKLPKANSENLRFLIKFLHKMSEYQEVNKMSPSNLSIVMGPNLIWPQGENGPSVLTTSTQSLIVEAFISHCDYFFPGDVDFGQHIKDPIQEIVPPPTVGVRCESTTRPRPGRESVNKRHTISLTEPTLAMPLSASAMSNHSAGMSDSNPDKVMIRLDADAATLERNRPHISSRSSSDTEMHSNGRYGKSCGLTNDGDKMRVSDLTSDMHSSTQCLTGLNGPVKRSITPPSKVAPPRGMHSDVYNTVFALQSLGDGWPDYLNRVRTLWDSHIHQHTPGLSADGVSNSQDQKSSPVSPDEASPGDGIRAGQGTKSDDDEMELNSMNSSSGEVAEYDMLNAATSGETDSSQTSNTDQTDNKLPAPDRIFQGGPAHTLVSSLHAGICNPVSAFESISSSVGSLNTVDNSFGSKAPSPKPPRRTNKKPAPLPPAERPHIPAPPPPCYVDKSQSSSLPDTTGTSTTVTTTTCASIANSTSSAFSNLPYPIKPPLPDHPPDRQQEHLVTTQDKQQEHPAPAQHDDKQEQPKAKPERPPEQHQASVREDRQEFPAKPDRPPSPKNVRPSGPPPERTPPLEKPDKPARPEKPDKPGGPSVERLYPSISPTTLGSAPAVSKKSPSTSSGEHSPPHMGKIILNAPSEVTEKPPLPPPPGVKPDVTSHSHHAIAEAIQGHRRQSSGSSRPFRPQPPPPPPPNKPTSISQQVESSEKQTPSGGDPDNQTPSSPKTGEDTYL